MLSCARVCECTIFAFHRAKQSQFDSSIAWYAGHTYTYTYLLYRFLDRCGVVYTLHIYIYMDQSIDRDVAKTSTCIGGENESISRGSIHP